LGSALAVSWIPRNLSADVTERAKDFIDLIGVLGLIGIILTFLFITESNATLYRIAFPIAGLFSCMMIISIVHPASRFSKIFSFYPLLWIGQRSYGIYLWHWIIFQITRPGIDLAGKPWALDAARILLVLFFADFSLRYVEEPFRTGTVQNWFRGMRYRVPEIKRKQRALIGASLVTVLAVTSSSVALALYRNSRLVIIPKEDISLQQTIISPTNEGIWLTGDSVILGIKTKLAAQEPISLVNAKVGRQIDDLIKAVKLDGPKVPHSKIVLDVGNNNIITRDQMVELMELIKNQPKIVIVNTAVPRVWKDKNNEIIAKRCIKLSKRKIN
jgi:hypothetical protein